MSGKKAAAILFIIIITGSSIIFFSSCKGISMDGMVVFTRTAGKALKSNYITGDDWRYVPRAQIVALNPDKPEVPAKILTAGYFSARSPQISFDGKYMLFSAQKNENDLWQIWEMNLADLKARLVISSNGNCTDPAYLPGERLVFSKLSVNDTLKAGHSLFTCNLDGSNSSRITFNPHTYLAASVLSDGRVLAIDRQVYPEQKSQMFVVMRPDGTKAELFYKPAAGSTLTSCGEETTEGKIVFIESEKDNLEKGNIISISYNRPLHSRVNLTSGIEGDFNSVFPMQSGNLLVSYRKSDSDRYALYEFDPVKKVLTRALYTDTGYNGLEAVEVRAHNRPKKLPSEVHMDIKTGLIVCQDVNLQDPQLTGKYSSVPKICNIEVMGIDSSLGVLQTAKDGSFYLRMLADKPFQIRSLDKNGHVLQSCDWIWLRPNERRGCVGCHEDQELVPENRIPLAVKKSPVIVPVHINKIKEKKIDTE